MSVEGQKNILLHFYRGLGLLGVCAYYSEW